MQSGEVTVFDSACNPKAYGPNSPNGAVFVEHGDEPAEVRNTASAPPTGDSRSADVRPLRVDTPKDRAGRRAVPLGDIAAEAAGPDLANADAYATAAFAMGTRAAQWTATLDGYEAMTILADGRVLLTQGFPAGG